MAFVLATTSKLDDLEPALLRSGRLDNELEINVPTATQRLQARYQRMFIDAD